MKSEVYKTTYMYANWNKNNSLKFESTKEIETNSNIWAWFLILGCSTVQHAIY
jgi:hypothetical protein